MTYLIMYDIADRDRRNQVAAILEEYGIRMQYSVFSLQVKNKELEVIKNQLVSIVNLEEDSLRCYPVCSDCMERMYSLKEDWNKDKKSYQIL